jgi:hypothetical protein
MFSALPNTSARADKMYAHLQERRMPRCSFGNGCKIPLVSTGSEIDLVRPAEARERNWLPMAIAAAVVLILAAVAVLVLEHGRPSATVTPISAAPDPYAASLPIASLAMSQSDNRVGGKTTYIDGHIANTGSRTVTGVTVQVLFRTFAHEVAQNETIPLKLIRTRVPYVDVEPVSAAPLKPGGEQDFRLIFDAVSPDWNGDYPEVRIIRVEGK